jgi:hypothetical protein
MRVVTTRAVHPALSDGMMRRFEYLGANLRVALETNLGRSRARQQSAVALLLHHRVAGSAADFRRVMRPSLEAYLRSAIVALQAHRRLAGGRELLIRQHVGRISAFLVMLAPGPMAGLTTASLLRI